ncbi:unnamed protein product [Merluccius merluccius]
MAALRLHPLHVLVVAFHLPCLAQAGAYYGSNQPPPQHQPLPQHNDGYLHQQQQQHLGNEMPQMAYGKETLMLPQYGMELPQLPLPMGKGKGYALLSTCERRSLEVLKVPSPPVLLDMISERDPKEFRALQDHKAPPGCQAMGNQGPKESLGLQENLGVMVFLDSLDLEESLASREYQVFLAPLAPRVKKELALLDFQENLVPLESRDMQVHKDYRANQDHKVCRELDNLD